MGTGRFMSGCALAAVLAVAAVGAAEVPIVNDVLGAEGPLVVDGNLYYVSWISNTLSKWDGRSVSVLNTTAGCGHNGLALTRHQTLLIACDDVRGAILEVDLTGKLLRRWDTDSRGRELDGGINDKTAKLCKEAGANVMVAGSYIFGNDYKKMIASLK